MQDEIKETKRERIDERRRESQRRTETGNKEIKTLKKEGNLIYKVKRKRKMRERKRRNIRKGRRCEKGKKRRICKETEGKAKCRSCQKRDK